MRLIKDYIFRANYLNISTILKVARFELTYSTFEYPQGYLPPEVEVILENGEKTMFKAKLIDTPFLLDKDKKSFEYLGLLLNSENQLTDIRESYWKPFLHNAESFEFFEDKYIIPSTSKSKPEILKASHKGAWLLQLIQEGYPVPDFCILTADAYKLPRKEHKLKIRNAVQNLEQMTGAKLGDEKNPLVFAMRCAMPKYIPGLMPTYLNVGITHKTFLALQKKYSNRMAARIYLHNLKTICHLICPGTSEPLFDEPFSQYSFRDLYNRIAFYFEKIRNVDEKLLEDPYYQLEFFFEQIDSFYKKHQDVLYSLIKRNYYPSVILQKMVWTIRDDESYPGVLYSRHSRTGLGQQIESFPNIFGEDIMSGEVDAIDTEFFDREEIKEKFPAVYHFIPLLDKLEKKLEAPVTVELAAESYKKTFQFACLQLNVSELTGRSTLLSAIDLHEKGIIDANRVLSLVHPYHFNQIFSDTIEEKSFLKLQFFSKGISVLPRLAISAKVYFSHEKAIEAKNRGEKVCFCKYQFHPSDTLVLSDVDAIVSLNPAAIHVVTACLSYGIPAFLNLEDFNIRLEEDKLINANGIEICEGDWITVSSKNKTIYKGKADFSKARFQRYLDGEKFELLEKEDKVFSRLASAYNKYKTLSHQIDPEKFTSLTDLSKLVLTDLNNEPAKARRTVNAWIEIHEKYYLSEILKSPLGSHKEQSVLFDLLAIDRKILFFKSVVKQCEEKNLSGLSAGSFMLGRFVSIIQDVSFWKKFDAKEIVFLVNELVLYWKYLDALHTIGERKLKQVFDNISSQGLEEISISPGHAKDLISLKLSGINWSEVSGIIERVSYEPETEKLFRELSKSYGELYNYSAKWELNKLKKVCSQNNIELPEKDEK